MDAKKLKSQKTPHLQTSQAVIVLRHCRRFREALEAIPLALVVGTSHKKSGLIVMKMRRAGVFIVRCMYYEFVMGNEASLSVMSIQPSQEDMGPRSSSLVYSRKGGHNG